MLNNVYVVDVKNTYKEYNELYRLNIWMMAQFYVLNGTLTV